MMKRSLLHLLRLGLVLGLVLGATADASVWDRALQSPEDEAAKDLYDAKLLEGDTATLTATIQSSSIASNFESIRRAEAAYRAAAAVRPREAEPYYRIGNLLYQMYYNCESLYSQLPSCDPNNLTHAESVIAAWEEFERRAPLDPRVAEILLPRALLNTKLINGNAGDRRHLEKAARDYQAALDRGDGLSATRGDEQLLGNLAETYMMLGQLDDAIASYYRAIAAGAARVSTVYGLAVALDRDGSGDQAVRQIQGQGAEGLEAFTKECIRRSVFFVPSGESAYYFALASEAAGNLGAALTLWHRYLASGAHPEFQPRVREHIEQLHDKHVHPEPLPPELNPPPC
jgi:tetratricopeptide (TPR) repeat protein